MGRFATHPTTIRPIRFSHASRRAPGPADRRPVDLVRGDAQRRRQRIVEPCVSLASTPRCHQPLAGLAAGHQRRVDVDAGPQAAAATAVTPCPISPFRRVCRRSPSSAARAWYSPVFSSAITARADRARQRVAAERRAVLARLQHAEHLVRAGDRGHRHDAAAERLAEDVHVGHDALVLDGEVGAGAAEARLDLVGDEQHAPGGGHLADAGQVAGRRHDHAGLALDRLDQHGDGVVVDRGGQRVQVAVGHDLEARACTGRSRRARPDRWRS